MKISLHIEGDVSELGEILAAVAKIEHGAGEETLAAGPGIVVAAAESASSPPSPPACVCTDCGLPISRWAAGHSGRCLSCSSKRTWSAERRAAASVLFKRARRQLGIDDKGHLHSSHATNGYRQETGSVPRCSKEDCALMPLFYQEPDGTEWRCLNGHITYPEGFVPLDKPDEDVRRRRPTHRGSYL